MTLERRQLVLCAVVLGFAALAARPVCAQSFAGKGEWRSLASDAIRGTWSATLLRDGDAVTGTFKLTGSNVFAGGPVTGTLDKSSIMLGIMAQGEKQASFNGKLDGQAIKGEWESDAVKDHGVWFGTLSLVDSTDASEAKP